MRTPGKGQLPTAGKGKDLRREKKDISLKNHQHNIDFMGHYVLFQQVS